MAARYLLGMALVVGAISSISGNRCRNEPSCRVTRVHGMKSADCYKLDLHNFPRCLTGDAEIIDLSYNRIREITSGDLKKFKNLKILYLGDNMITKIDPEAFADKTDLQTLDLSYNGFANTIPDVIFQLPSLKNLYLSQNQNINIIEILQEAVPITSPLSKLDISYNSFEEVQMLPKLGMLPNLVKYNVSGMDLIFRTSDTAGLCNLKHFINDNVTMFFENDCDCWTISKWFNHRGVRVTSPLNCAIGEKECPYEMPLEDEELFTMCKQQHAEMIYQEKLSKTLMVSSIVVAVLVVTLLLLGWRWRRSRAKRRQIENSILRHQMKNHM